MLGYPFLRRGPLSTFLQDEAVVLKRALVVGEVFHVQRPDIVTIEQRLDEMRLAIRDVQEHTVILENSMHLEGRSVSGQHQHGSIVCHIPRRYSFQYCQAHPRVDSKDCRGSWRPSSLCRKPRQQKRLGRFSYLEHRPSAIQCPLHQSLFDLT